MLTTLKIVVKKMTDKIHTTKDPHFYSILNQFGYDDNTFSLLLADLKLDTKGPYKLRDDPEKRMLSLEFPDRSGRMPILSGLQYDQFMVRLDPKKFFKSLYPKELNGRFSYRVYDKNLKEKLFAPEQGIVDNEEVTRLLKGNGYPITINLKDHLEIKVSLQRILLEIDGQSLPYGDSNRHQKAMNIISQHEGKPFSELVDRQREYQNGHTKPVNRLPGIY